MNNELIKHISGEITPQTCEIPVRKGTHTFKWEYSKDRSKTEGSDCGWLSRIKYPLPTIPVNFSEVSFRDDESDNSSGNNDRIIQNFEVVQITGVLESLPVAQIQAISPQLPDNILLTTPAEITGTSDGKTRFCFSIVINQRWNKDKVEFPIVLQDTAGVTKTYMFSAPFQKTDLSKRYLEKEKVLQSEKFDYTSKEQLDRFLSLFSNSDFAPTLFRLRMECCRRFREQVLTPVPASQEVREEKLVKVINEYNEFIERYPDKLLTRVAIHECFDLYTQVNRISFYHNFIQRYPYTEHSLVAQKHIQCLLFALVCTEDTIDAYEKFIQLYPEDSFYRSKCIELAKNKAVEIERKKWDSQQNLDALILSVKRNEEANKLVSQLDDILQEHANLPVEQRMQKIVTDTRIDRIKETIKKVYPETHAVRALLYWTKMQEVKDLNEGIYRLLEKQKKEIISGMDTHFGKLQKNLEQNFQQIQQRFNKVDQQLGKLEKEMQAGFANVNKNIEAVNTNIKSLHDNLQAIHTDIRQRFDKIDNKLSQIDTRIQDGFAQVNQKLDTGFQQIDNYFKVLHNDLNQINSNIIQIDAGISQISQQNQQFLRQNTQILNKLEENGRLYTGYYNCPRADIQCAVSSTVSEALKLGISYIPVAGPIITKVGAPAIEWVGNKITDGAKRLWNKIF